MKQDEGIHKYGKYWIDENGIYNFQYHQGSQIDLEDAQFISREREKLFNGRQYPILVDSRGLKRISNEASKHFSSKENLKLFPAAAFIIDSFFGKMMGNYYLKLFPHSIPTKLFTSKHDAVKWLLKHHTQSVP